MIKSVVNSRWFPLVDAILVLTCGAIWFLWPQAGGGLLPLALLPWMLRIAAGRPPVRRTLLDLPIGLFLLTAALGVWAAYDRQTALAKFWLLISAVLVYYSLSRQKRLNFWQIAHLFSAIAALIGLFFLLTHDWRLQPADLGLLNQWGSRWMEVRPGLPFQGLHPNIAGGLIAVFAPFPLALSIRAGQKKQARTGVFAAFTGLVAGIGLVFTSSRAAWVALALGLGVWFLWGCSGLIARLLARKQAQIFVVLLLPLILTTLGLALQMPAKAVDLLGYLPGSDSSVSRLEIFANTLRLVADFPYTGGGLTAFPGLYSQYVMVLPVFLFGYSHNLYLDIALEQGLLGLAAFLVIAAVSLGRLVAGERSSTLRWAIITGLLVMLIHGLADDAPYGVQGTPLLFALPGLAAGIYRYEENVKRETSISHSSWRSGEVIFAVFGLFSLSLIGLVTKGAIRSTWYSNLGAVGLARYELAEFSNGQWQETLDLVALSPAIDLFKTSLQHNPENVTANYRLGTIAMLARDFRTAQAFLERANAADPSHRGVRKVLGYCYAWSGEIERAASLLGGIPEARKELEVYVWWWRDRGRPELSQFAAEMLDRLAESANPLPLVP
ncbi:MAG TPA: O-antigen ligase family protein [Anaerolineales bacterium]|nr:O-antigen ligase family protein [Anaerolineales bacterium]